MHSKIVISSDFEGMKDEIYAEFKDFAKFFISDEFLLENSALVIKEAYIAEKQEKLIVIMAKNFRIEAQNALLKIMEEPPRNIFFCIVSPSKNLLLPTIRSRLMIENRLVKKQRLESGLNLKQLDLKELDSFLSEISKKEKSDEFSKNELKELITSIVLEAMNLYKFSQKELEYFYSLIRLAELNSKSEALLTPLLLSILRKAKR